MSITAYIENNRTFNVRDYGATGVGVADDYVPILACNNTAAAAGYGIVFPPGTYRIATPITFTTPVHLMSGAMLLLEPGATVSLADNVRLSGDGQGSLIKTTALRTAAVIRIDSVQEVEITDIRVSHDGWLPEIVGDPLYGLVEITGGDGNTPTRRIRIHRCRFEGHQPTPSEGRTQGRMGVWVNPTAATDEIRDVEIYHNTFDGLEYGIVIGSYDDPPLEGEKIDNVAVHANHMVGTGIQGNVPTGTGAYDRTVGIQLFKRAKNVSVVGNHVGFFGMNINIAHGGENVVVSSNLTFDGDTGILFDANIGTYPTATFGLGRNLTISGNACLGGNYGVRLTTADALAGDPSTALDFPYYVTVAGNLVWGTNYDGIQISAPYVACIGNTVAECCRVTTDDGWGSGFSAAGRAGIRIGSESPDSADEFAHDILVQGNISVNNRSNSALKTNGFRFHNCKRIVVTGNVAAHHASFTPTLEGTQDVGFKVESTCEKLTFKGNTAEGNADADLDIDGTAEVFAETIAILIGSAAAGSEFVKPVFIAPHRAHVLSYSFTNAALITAHGSNYTTLILRNKGTNGASSDNVGDAASSAVNFTAFVPRAVETPHATRKKLVKGTILAVEKEDENAGAAITDMLFTLNYATH